MQKCSETESEASCAECSALQTCVERSNDFSSQRSKSDLLKVSQFSQNNLLQSRCSQIRARKEAHAFKMSALHLRNRSPVDGICYLTNGLLLRSHFAVFDSHSRFCSRSDVAGRFVTQAKKEQHFHLCVQCSRQLRTKPAH